MRALKPLVFTSSLVPVGVIAVDALGGAYVDPIAGVLNALGFWTLVFLTLTLACTPAKILLSLTWPNKVRRVLGLFAFFYASLHLTAYLVLDQALDLAAVWEDISKRKFITVGFASYLLLVPLAVTSTDAMVRRLGFKRWKRLHRLSYVAALGGVVHFVWRVKADYLEPGIFATILTALLLVRLVPMIDRAVRRRRATASRSG